jgi:lipoyl(octanoyl) transferase
MKVRDLGLIEYSESLKVQDETLAAVVDHKLPDTVLVCEHPAVITVGRALGSREEVFATTLPVFEIPRGGRATLHLPGQIVVYPVVDLNKRTKDLHAFMRLLENGIVDTLADFRIEGASIAGKTGVWVPRPRQALPGSHSVNHGSKSASDDGAKKIASIGIAVKHWVTYHGLALNVSCDLNMFKQLSPCGFSPEVMTSMLNEMPDDYVKMWALTPENLFARVKKRLVENLIARFEGEVSSDEPLVNEKWAPV